jgi:hypothetical protein
MKLKGCMKKRLNIKIVVADKRGERGKAGVSSI